MATTFVSVASEAAALAQTTEVAIIGGGICGILAAKGCRDRNLLGMLSDLLGASGGGKTTLADIVLGLVEADRGRLLLDGQEIGTAAARRNGYGPRTVRHAARPC